VKRFYPHLAIACIAALVVVISPSLGSCAIWNVGYTTLDGNVRIDLENSYGSRHVNAQAVQFQGTSSDSAFEGNWYGYCVDILDWFKQPYFGELTPDEWDSYSGQAGQYTGDKLFDAAWLMWNYDPDLSGNTLEGYTNTETMTALQLAIWESIYELSGTLDVTQGDLIFGNVSSNVIYIANNIILPDLLDPRDEANIGDTVLLPFGSNLDDSQDLLMGHHTPEPASMLLFASAAGTLGFIRFRRKRRKHL
jgi:hypothetical protein